MLIYARVVQELERVYSHEDATSTERPYVFVAWAMPSLSGLRVVLPGEDASALRVQVGGGPKPPTQKEQKGEERHDDYYANVGDAIRTLREDVPTLFTSKLNCAPFSWCLLHAKLLQFKLTPARIRDSATGVPVPTEFTLVKSGGKGWWMLVS